MGDPLPAQAVYRVLGGIWPGTRTETDTASDCAAGMFAGVPSNALYSASWSPDCSLLAASSAGGAVYLFDYAKGIALKKWQLHSQPSLRVSVPHWPDAVTDAVP